MKKRDIDLALKLMDNPESVLDVIEHDLNQKRDNTVSNKVFDEAKLKQFAPELVVGIAVCLTEVNPNYKKLKQQYSKSYEDTHRDLATLGKTSDCQIPARQLHHRLALCARTQP